MKRTTAILLAVLLLAGLCACGEKPVEVDPSTLPGTITDNVYTNEFLKLQCTCPEGWFFYDEAQMAELNNATQDIMTGDTAELMEKNGQFLDMFLSSADGRLSANLNFQLNDHKTDLLSDKALFEAMETAMRQQIQQMGMNVTAYTVETLQFLGEEKTCIHMEYGDLGMNQYVLYFRNNTNYYAAMTFTVMGDGDVQQLLDCFSKLP